MTNPQVTQTDRDWTDEILTLATDCCKESSPEIWDALENLINEALAKVRQQARAEMQAACAALIRNQEFEHVEALAHLIEKYAQIDGTNALEEYVSTVSTSEMLRIRNKYTTPEQRKQWLANIQKGIEVGREEDEAELKAKVDETVAAVVEKIIGTLCRYCEKGAPVIRNGSYVHDTRSGWDHCRAMLVRIMCDRDCLQFQQILAERDKRVREEAQRLHERTPDGKCPVCGGATDCHAENCIEVLTVYCNNPDCDWLGEPTSDEMAEWRDGLVERTEARMREPLPNDICKVGHPTASLYYEGLDPDDLDAKPRAACSICAQGNAQQRELREALEKLLNAYKTTLRRVSLRHHPELKNEAYLEARRALGEKGMLGEDTRLEKLEYLGSYKYLTCDEHEGVKREPGDADPTGGFCYQCCPLEGKS